MACFGLPNIKFGGPGLGDPLDFKITGQTVCQAPSHRALDSFCFLSMERSDCPDAGPTLIRRSVSIQAYQGPRHIICDIAEFQ